MVSEQKPSGQAVAVVQVRGCRVHVFEDGQIWREYETPKQQLAPVKAAWFRPWWNAYRP